MGMLTLKWEKARVCSSSSYSTEACLAASHVEFMLNTKGPTYHFVFSVETLYQQKVLKQLASFLHQWQQNEILFLSRWN